MSSSNPNTDTTSGSKRDAIKKLIDASIVTVNLPDCSPTEFFPPSRVAEIATLKNILDYTAEEPFIRWGEEQRTDFAESIYRNGRELFICFAKKKWPMEFLDIVVNEADFFDEHIHGERTLDTGYHEYDELQDNLIDEMEIHKMGRIDPHDYLQGLIRKQHPFESVAIIPNPDLTLPISYHVRIHEDFWDEADRDFLMIEYEDFPGKEYAKKAITGFFSYHEDQTRTYCLLFPKDWE